MRISILSVLLAGAAMSVSAEVSNANANIRFGHALANANVNGNDDSGNVPHIMLRPLPLVITTTELKLSGDANEDDDVLRFYRFPDGEPHHHHHHHHHDDNEPHHRHHHHHHDMNHKHGGSFSVRVHRAIMALGPWEGRAVAFVLGCGIGVLIRMFWVMSVIAYRTLKGDKMEEEAVHHEYIVFEHDGDNVYAPLSPPEYSDEKVKEVGGTAKGQVEVVEARA